MNQNLTNRKPDSCIRTTHKRCRREVGSDDNKWRDELPQDMLDLIAQRLETPGDFCRFGAVCKSWHKAAVKPNYDQNPNYKVPCFLNPLPPAETTVGRTKFTHRLFNPYTRQSVNLRLPTNTTPQTRLLGSGHGWVAICDPQYGREVRLLNPLCRREIVPVTPNMSCDSLNEENYSRLTLSLNPSDGSFTAVVHGDIRKRQANIAKVPTAAGEHPRRHHWQTINGNYSSVLPYKGRLYAFDYFWGSLYVNDNYQSNGPSLSFRRVPGDDPKLHNFIIKPYLVPGIDDLLYCRMYKKKWVVYKVETKEAGAGKENVKMVRMRSLGDGAVFISELSSVYVTELPGGNRWNRYRKNSIYFEATLSGQEVSNIWEYCLEDDDPCMEVFYACETRKDSSNLGVWFVPTLW